MHQFVDLVKNKPWVYMTLMAICTNFFNGFRYAVAGYMFTYCMGGDITIGRLIINYTVFMAFGEVTCMIFGGLSPVVAKWLGSKRGAFMFSGIVCFVTSLIFFFIPMDPKYIWVMIGVSILTSAGIGIYSPLVWSMYADVADYATKKNGSITDSVLQMVWALFSLFPAALALLLILLSYLYPIKK